MVLSLELLWNFDKSNNDIEERKRRGETSPRSSGCFKKQETPVSCSSLFWTTTSPPQSSYSGVPAVLRYKQSTATQVSFVSMFWTIPSPPLMFTCDLDFRKHRSAEGRNMGSLGLPLCTLNKAAQMMKEEGDQEGEDAIYTRATSQDLA
jgi:hypothetical protein